MESLIGEWVGKLVSVKLRLPGYNEFLEGKLVQAGESGVMLDLPKKGRTFVPISAILHINLSEGR